MIFYLSELADNPRAFLVFFAAFAVAILIGLSFHEFTHAWSANELGDDTAARRGRLTLNPLVHLDPLGTAMILLIGFGMAKPTPVDPGRLKYGPIRGNAIVAFAGPASNFFFAAVASIPLRFGLIESRYDGIGRTIANASSLEEFTFIFLYFIVLYNVLLGIFNLLPIPPLDGFKVLGGLVPREVAIQLSRLEPYGMGILMTLIVISYVTPFSPIGWLIGGVSNTIFELLV